MSLDRRLAAWEGVLYSIESFGGESFWNSYDVLTNSKQHPTPIDRAAKVMSGSPNAIVSFKKLSLCMTYTDSIMDVLIYPENEDFGQLSEPGTFFWRGWAKMLFIWGDFRL